MKKVLFLCTGNSCRSQMAEGLLRVLGGGEFEAHSAGTHPSTLHPMATEAMREIGIDISHQRSKNVSTYLDSEFDFVITVCDSAQQSCPVFPGVATRIHWSISDPASATGTNEERHAAFRTCRDAISEHVRQFVSQYR